MLQVGVVGRRGGLGWRPMREDGIRGERRCRVTGRWSVRLLRTPLGGA